MQRIQDSKYSIPKGVSNKDGRPSYFDFPAYLETRIERVAFPITSQVPAAGKGARGRKRIHKGTMVKGPVIAWKPSCRGGEARSILPGKSFLAQFSRSFEHPVYYCSAAVAISRASTKRDPYSLGSVIPSKTRQENLFISDLIHINMFEDRVRGGVPFAVCVDVAARVIISHFFRPRLSAALLNVHGTD